MNRREVLRYTAWITGSAVSASLASAVLSGCSEAPKPPVNPDIQSGELPILHFFTPEQFLLVALLTDTLLPRTDSPSATDVNVHTTIDTMLGYVLPADYKSRFKTLWIALERHLIQLDFNHQDHHGQVAILRALELSTDAGLSDARLGLVELKQQTIAYYLTTEEVGKNHLNYLPIPGEYKPCIPVEDVNNTAWAL